MRRDELFKRAAEAHERALTPYHGRVVLWRAEEGLGQDGNRVAPDLGWTGLVPTDTRVHVVPAAHLELMQPPFAEGIARNVRTHLAPFDPPDPPPSRPTSEAVPAAPAAPPSEVRLPGSIDVADE